MRETILDAAQALVQDRDLNAVSFQDLADAVGLKKPSLFHHFRSKDALAAALMERCRTTYGARYGEVLAREDLSEPEKLHGIALIFEEGLKENHVCLLGALATSSSCFSSGLDEEMQTTASLVIERYAAVFQEGREKGTLQFLGEPEVAAAAFLAMLQGLQVLTRAKGDIDLFLPAAESYIDSISSPQTK